MTPRDWAAIQELYPDANVDLLRVEAEDVMPPGLTPRAPVSPIGLGQGYRCTAGYDYSGYDYATGRANITFQPYLYAAIRATNPRDGIIVVETGMQAGVSTVHALRAMSWRGLLSRLITIDGSFETDDAMHEQLRWWGIASEREVWQFWRPLARTSQSALPLFADVPIGVFVHDSDHEYETQSFEYAWAWDRLERGGCLISDDFVWNGGRAWAEFSARVGAPWYIIGSAAIMKKG